MHGTFGHRSVNIGLPASLQGKMHIYHLYSRVDGSFGGNDLLRRIPTASPRDHPQMIWLIYLDSFIKVSRLTSLKIHIVSARDHQQMFLGSSPHRRMSSETSADVLASLWCQLSQAIIPVADTSEPVCRSPVQDCRLFLQLLCKS